MQVQREEGQNLVLIALSMIALVGMMALVLDGGNGFAQRRRMQNAADAGVIAGVRELALGNSYSVAVARADEYARTRNGADSVQTSLDGTTLTVQTSRTFPTFFAMVLGLPNMTAAASASARYGVAGAGGDLLPMAIYEQVFIEGQIYQLWDNILNGPGGFGWLDWNGVPVGNPELADNILHPANSGLKHIGEWILSGPGVQNSSAVKNALNWWLAKPEDERHVTIIVYDLTQGSGANLRYRVAGFAEFTLTGYNFKGSNKWVEGKFRRWVDPSGVLDPNPCGFGVCVYSVRMTQ
jgi:hypothetical protein